MIDVAITGTGLFVPPSRVTNAELVDAFNQHVSLFNTEHASAIAAGTIEEKRPSSAEFIEKASGIKARHFIEASGILDPKRLRAHLPADAYGNSDTPSLQASMAIEAAKQALAQAGRRANEVDLVIFSSASPQRYFPAIGIEVQKFLGTKGSAYDMVMGCSSATFALINAISAIKAGTAKRVLMVNPEIFSTMVNFGDRDSHFIFGDIAVAALLEAVDDTKSNDIWQIEHLKQATQLSENITSNYGPLTRLDDQSLFRQDMFFVQQGRKVFKELLPLVTDFIDAQIQEAGLKITDFNRLWLHQANLNMNLYAVRKLLGREPEPLEAPIVLEDYGNTAGAGSLVAFHHHRSDLPEGARGLLCSFGAGYSIGSLVLKKQSPR